jgi:hypothetical protein
LPKRVSNFPCVARRGSRNKSGPLRVAAAMDDPSQSAAMAAGRQDRAVHEKFRAKMQAGAMTGFGERNSKWDVEYEGKDAVGTLVRPFEPSWGDSRPLPSKMLGETNAMAVARSMGRNLPHSGAGDGEPVFKTEENPALLKKMLREEQEKDAPPPLLRRPDNIQAQGAQQARLEKQWAVGLHGGSFGMHTRTVKTHPPAHSSDGAANIPFPAPTLGWIPADGPPAVDVMDAQTSSDVNSMFVRGHRKTHDVKQSLQPPLARSPKKKVKDTSVMKGGEYDVASSYSRASPVKHSHQLSLSAQEFLGEDNLPRARDKPLRNEGAHAMLDRKGPNIMSGPIPRDGFTTDVYDEATRSKLHEMGYSDILGETGERPDEIDNGTDHLDKLEKLGKSAKDLSFFETFTGNTGLFDAKLNVGGPVDAVRRGGADMDGSRSFEDPSFFAAGNARFGAARG